MARDKTPSWTIKVNGEERYSVEGEASTFLLDQLQEFADTFQDGEVVFALPGDTRKFDRDDPLHQVMLASQMVSFYLPYPPDIEVTTKNITFPEYRAPNGAVF